MPTGKKVIVRMSNGDVPKLYMYGFIDSIMAESFVKELNWLASVGHKAVDLHINSLGGNNLDGVAIISAMRTCGMEITGYVDGIAASMASLIALYCNKLYMNKYARMLFHQPSGFAQGTVEEMTEQLEFLKTVQDDAIDMYCKRTGMTADQVKSVFMNGKDNIYMADKALSTGLVDGVFEGEEVELPEDSNAEGVYMAFQTRMESKFSDIMEKQFLSPRMASLLGVAQSADAAAVEAAMTAMHGKALQADTYKQQLEELNENLTTNQVKMKLDKAKEDKLITDQQYTVFMAQYAKNPDALDDVLKTMAPFTSIMTKLNQQPPQTGQRTPQVTALMAKGYTALMSSGEMAALHSLDPEAAQEVKEAHFASKRK